MKKIKRLKSHYELTSCDFGGISHEVGIEQGVVLSFRFAVRKVRRAPRVLRMAAVSQSSVKFGEKRVLLVGANNYIKNPLST